MKGVLIREDFTSTNGDKIKKGEYWFDGEATEQRDGKEEIYTKAGYDITIKLTRLDFQKDEVQEIEIAQR